MLEIRTIADFSALSPHHQSSIIKELKTKIRLDDWLRAENKKRTQRMRAGEVLVIKRKDIVIKARDGTDIHPSSITRCLKRVVLDCMSVEMDVVEPILDAQGGPTYDPNTEQDATQLVRKMVPYADMVEEYIDPRLQKIFDTGTAWHKVMQGYGYRGAWGPGENYEDEVPIDPYERDEGGDIINDIAERYGVKGAVDGVIDPYIVEVPGIGTVGIRVIHEYKTINSNGYKNLNKPKTDHKWQATVYSKMLDIPVVVYFYTNKDTQQDTDFPVPFDQHLWATIEEKINLANSYSSAGLMPDWSLTAAVLNPRECTECGYCKMCDPPQPEVKKLTARRR